MRSLSEIVAANEARAVEMAAERGQSAAELRDLQAAEMIQDAERDLMSGLAPWARAGRARKLALELAVNLREIAKLSEINRLDVDSDMRMVKRIAGDMADLRRKLAAARDV